MNSAQTFPSSSAPFKRGRFTKQESTKRAFTFSLIAHLGLLAFLMIGISWNTSTPSGVEVELWDATPQVQMPATPAPELKTEIKEGRPVKQAVAIAYSEKREAEKKKKKK